jgi:hypothetical protein
MPAAVGKQRQKLDKLCGPTSREQRILRFQQKGY